MNKDQPDTKHPPDVKTLVRFDSNRLEVKHMHMAQEMAHIVEAKLRGHLADEIARRAAERLSDEIGLSKGRLVEFIQFLYEDPEIHGRFTAYVARKRILRDTIHDK